MIKRTLRHTFTLLNVDHVKLGPKWNYKNVISPYFRLYYIDAGEGEISDVSTTLKLEPGYLYIIPSFTFCNLTCQNQMGQYFIQFFEESSDGISLFAHNRSIFKVKTSEIDVMNFVRLLEINPGRGINRSDNPRIYEKNIFYKEYQELNNQQNMATFIETNGILLQLVSRFLTPEILKHKETSHIPVKILNAISYIQLNLHLDLSVTHLAQQANQHTDYFSRLFQQCTGERPVKYIHEKRIERAQYLMVTTRMTYPEIAEQTGFENIFYFSKVFKKVTGMSPGNYKKQIELVRF
ncbi:AraC-type DNA-binding protein [Mucilaginibacter lappiensis]|uniref:AraC-like DNA-binding protein n=1 Tax=Mucilaginibacter lappiensis TaxID=354630 RepID=A0ABR6PLM3_9SPHI|nr:AraC family transcriptional regulator [Mucilaginibacter lappiensis]MBB6110488.1 AraC-like DNA-binding protein [Mucilaginibacter lappiensis]SIR38955.1 AraC-type DNA-binding protein [Mucilaginibacter lappiensis]